MTDTDDQPTCGKGLAAHAPLPATLGELTAAVADVLAGHMPSLDLADENARAEHEAYAALVREHRAAAEQLRATAARMAGCRDLPMGRHDVAVLSTPDAMAPFARFVRLEEELVALLQARLAQDRAMLEGWGA
jgi:hypothetical protein